MKTIGIFFLVLLVHGQVWAGDGAKFFGNYSNMVVDGAEDPHFLSGYGVFLYKQDDRVSGNVAIAHGAPEPVVVALQETKFNALTKRLSFEITYSDGHEYSAETGPGGRESKTVLTFSGIVSPGRIVGQVTTRDGYCDTCKPRLKKVILKRTHELDPPDEAVLVP